MKKFPLIFPILIAVFSCSDGNSFQEEPLCAYAREILLDSGSEEYLEIAGTIPQNSKGCIFITGDMEQTGLLCDFLKDSDRRDNISGNPGGDGLDDFAGEQFILLYDLNREPYNVLFRKWTADTLRHVAIELSLDAIDTVSAISPYDRTGVGRKPAAKMIVFQSPYLAAFGEYDASGLFSEIGSSVRILSPLSCMADRMLSDGRESYRVAVFAPEYVTDDEVYQSFLRKACMNASRSLAECFVFHWNGEGENALASLLDKYSSEGGAARFDAILCDDLTVNPQSIKEECGIINSVLYEESMKYGGYLSNNVAVLSSAEETADAMYLHLRNTKSFRFRIAPPQSMEYITGEVLMFPYSENYID